MTPRRAARVPTAHRAGLFSRKLSLALSAASDADAILARAEADLERVTGEITEVAARLGGTPREVLARLSAAAPDEATILAFCTDAPAAPTAFVRDHHLVTPYDHPVDLIDVPHSNPPMSRVRSPSAGPSTRRWCWRRTGIGGKATRRRSACSSSRCSCAWSSTRYSTPGCTRTG
jgi:hypothetical protein